MKAYAKGPKLSSGPRTTQGAVVAWASAASGTLRIDHGFLSVVLHRRFSRRHAPFRDFARGTLSDGDLGLSLLLENAIHGWIVPRDEGAAAALTAFNAQRPFRPEKVPPLLGAWARGQHRRRLCCMAWRLYEIDALEDHLDQIGTPYLAAAALGEL